MKDFNVYQHVERIKYTLHAKIKPVEETLAIPLPRSQLWPKFKFSLLQFPDQPAGK